MAPRPAGRLIALEGIDGCGKSTQAGLLASRLGVQLTFEPGDTALGKLLRQVLLTAPVHPVPRAEALLLAADRAQHVDEVISPALSAGEWVVTDRYSGSTLAYQGWGRGLELDALRTLVRWAAGGCEPDLNVLVDVPVDVARRRLDAASPDRLERLDGSFFERVRQGYLAEAAADPSRWAVVDGTGPVDDVAASVTAVVRDRLGSPTGAGP